MAAEAGAGGAAGTGAEPETQQQHHQQLVRVKQEVKQEVHLSRNNSDLTLGISSDQEANVGVICLLHCTLPARCSVSQYFFLSVVLA